MTKFAFSFFAVTIILTLVIIKMANSAPPPTANRNYRTTIKSECQPANYLKHFKSKRPWYNPCNGVHQKITTERSVTEMFNRRTMSPTTRKHHNPVPITSLKPLIRTVDTTKAELEGPYTRGINTTNISSWFHYNETYYSFLTQLNTAALTPCIIDDTLKKWHKNVQVYVAAFEYLEFKQRRIDLNKNDKNNTSIELKSLLKQSISLLCEIESAINNTIIDMPIVLSRQVMMESRLTFRNNNYSKCVLNSADNVDNMFAKVRFTEFIKDLQFILSQPSAEKCHPTHRGTHKTTHKIKHRTTHKTRHNGKRSEIKKLNNKKAHKNNNIKNFNNKRKTTGHPN